MTFTTTRCLIRPFEQHDIEPFMAYRNDLDWMQHQSFKGLTYEEYKRSLLGDPSIAQGIQLAIIQKETDELIGDLYVQQEETTYWIGYTISPRHARQGYAHEVVSELIRHLSDQGAKTLKAGCLATNEPSIALLKKLNFVYLTTEADEQIYRLDVSPNKTGT
ncbi:MULTISPECIES: GNAT family N-acetyltransferase [unclassified Exiguobacterium]|uniref:GNAT family N-acetyltransferase n=1 Tax=unclassified Exiguobacterium TaxID=2644629 RepID=UPI00103F6A48|nr:MULTISPECIES: GNAT family N-acetyltransferase [unclassified Exiguobacterium]TCI71298.1 N-acetyltransferase [Exiguobacterium sp. IPCI3]TCI81276.1 N-acetyltransferase [Exiguobacterium sp. IPCH1]TCI82473.1 N-acetyltransferase [Exiguobacterium sp. IPBC4]